MKRPKEMQFRKQWEKLKEDEKDIDLADLGRRISRMDNPVSSLAKRFRHFSKRILNNDQH